MLLTQKQTKKERNRPKTIPRPSTGGGVTILKFKAGQVDSELDYLDTKLVYTVLL